MRLVAFRKRLIAFKDCEVKDMDSEGSPRRQRILYECPQIPCPS